VGPQPAHDQEDTEQPDRETVRRRKVASYFEYEFSVRKGDVDVDVDVDVPEFD